MSMEYQYATICEAISEAIPDRPAVIHGDRRYTWAEYEGRAARLAQAFIDAGLRPASKVALFLYNGIEYAESVFAAFKMRGVPINVNYRYLADEVVYVLENCDAEVVVYHASLGDRVREARARCGRVRLWIEVADGTESGLDGVVQYEDVIAGHDPAPWITRYDDDELIIYTGGTTGMPKGVLWGSRTTVEMLLTRLPVMVGLQPVPSPEAAPGLAKQLWDEGAAYVALPACPLMHGTAFLIGLLTPHLLGGTSVLLPQRRFDPAAVWSVIARESIRTAIIVGDPFAKPLLSELDAAKAEGRSYALQRFKFLISSGAMFAAETKAALLDHLPHLTITDALGATEGFMAMDITVRGKDTVTARLTPLPTTKLLRDDDTEIAPGSDEIGMVAVGGNVPQGYYNDPEKTAMVFREIDGVRYSFPGDQGMLAADGSLILLGRGNQSINTGGEKVWPEEVEEVVKTHPAIEDCLVFGVPDDRYGQRVAAVVALTEARELDEEDVRAHVRTSLAAYKAPRSFAVVEQVPRTPSGKADYPAARVLFEQALAPS
jgi:acyl-CoA synthetase (AMP-forming)/AMP-acid ligase II